MYVEFVVSVFIFGVFFGVTSCRFIDLFHYLDGKRQKEKFKENLKKEEVKK